MLVAANVKKERQRKNRVNRNTNISSIKRVNRKLKEVSRFSRVNNGKEMYKKKNCCTCRVVFFAN